MAVESQRAVGHLFGRAFAVELCRDAARDVFSRQVAVRILFALALLSGEAALGAAAYLFAYVVWVEGSLWDRLSLLFAVCGDRACLGGIYGALGYGTVDSGMYIDPLRSPVQYLIAVGSRLPLLLVAQLAVPPADLWMQLSPEVQVQAGLAAGFARAGGAFRRSAFARRPAERFLPPA